MAVGHGWPDLSRLDLGPTIDALHLFSQVVGKTRMMLTPWENHGWHVPLYVTAKGLGTGLIPLEGAALQIDFDFLEDAVVLRSTDGPTESIALEGTSVAAFHADFMAALGSLGAAATIDLRPNEIPNALRFNHDRELRAYDGDVARAYWRALVQVQRVFQAFRTRFVGKCSPIHVFWGSFDLAVTRFSGRAAPPHPGGGVNLPDSVAREAYSHEVSSAGFWPGSASTGGPCFYSYAYPTPIGFASHIVEPRSTRFDEPMGEFLLPYAEVIASPDPDAAVMAFLQSTYEAAADLADWDREFLERPQGLLGRPPRGS